MQKSISDKWDIAKRCLFCFRCLAEGHSDRKRSRKCSQNGWKAMHYRLLHQLSQETELKTADLHSTTSSRCASTKTYINADVAAEL